MRFDTPAKWATEKLHIWLVGVGGTGSHVLDGLVAMNHALVNLGHPGISVRVFDPDTVSPTNVGRQRFHTSDIGHKKAIVLAHRARMFYGLDITAIPAEFCPDALRSGPPDLLVTCVDRASVRAEIGKYGRSEMARFTTKGCLWLDFGNGDHDGQVVLGHLEQKLTSGLRLPNVYDLYPELESMPDDRTHSCSMEAALRSQDLFVNRAHADAGLALLWNLLRHGGSNYHGSVVNLLDGTVKPIRVDPAVWDFMGYRSKPDARAA